jgi:hypothetical protein
MANHKLPNHHWFVSFETPKQTRRGIRLHVRQIKAFSTEPRPSNLTDETNILAGTFLSAPKRRIVSGWHLRRWIEEP